MSGGKVLQASVSFTLPISCQICLGKVKEPVTCSNQHVFCSRCMNFWLDRNSRCPTCRVEITSQSPLKKIIGGDLQSQEEPVPDRSTFHELRRTRLELVVKEYEEYAMRTYGENRPPSLVGNKPKMDDDDDIAKDEIFLLENKLERCEKENLSLKKQSDCNTSKDSSLASSSSDSLERSSEVCSKCANIKDIDTMLSLTKKLQEATKTYGKMEEEVAEVKQLNSCLIKRNDDLKRENEKIREEVETRSPMKFGRLTVATLQTRLQSAEKEIAQLNKALEKSDIYTEQLQTELKTYKSATCTTAEDITGSSLCSSGQNEQNSILSQAFTAAVTFDSPSYKGKLFQSVLPSVDSDLTANQNACLVNLDETSKASSYIEMQSYENAFNEACAQASLTDGKTSFNRKLRFEESSEEMASSSSQRTECTSDSAE